MLFYKFALCLLIVGIAQAKPGLKQGGAACQPQPNYCMNGGTCYTQYTQRPVPVPTTTPMPPVTCLPPVTTTTTTPCAPVTYAPVTTCAPIYYTTTTTPVPTTTQYVWVTQPVCGCQPQYVGDRCEQPVTLPPTLPPVTTPPVCIPQTTQPPATLPPVTLPPVTLPPVTLPPIYSTAPANRCDSVQCLNGGTCNEIDVSPFTVCLCPANFTGSQCETQVQLDNSTEPATVPPYGPVNVPVSSTFIPHCNFTIKLLNDGAYTARMRVSYKIDGVQQPIYTSPNLPIIGNTAQVTIPWYATDLVVSLERLGFNWAGIVQDTNINTVNWCTKCYKVWNDVTYPRWDYMTC